MNCKFATEIRWNEWELKERHKSSIVLDFPTKEHPQTWLFFVE